jgi:hypothetical protein
VFESEHPYPHNADIRHKISFPGAERLEITFDDRSRTETDCDYLQFFDSVGNIVGADKYHGRPGVFAGVGDVPVLHFQGSFLEARFRSDRSNNDWGYRFHVNAFFSHLLLPERKFYSVARLLREQLVGCFWSLSVSGSVLNWPPQFQLQFPYSPGSILQIRLSQPETLHLITILSNSMRDFCYYTTVFNSFCDLFMICQHSHQADANILLVAVRMAFVGPSFVFKKYQKDLSPSISHCTNSKLHEKSSVHIKRTMLLNLLDGMSITADPSAASDAAGLTFFDSFRNTDPNKCTLAQGSVTQLQWELCSPSQKSCFRSCSSFLEFSWFYRHLLFDFFNHLLSSYADQSMPTDQYIPCFLTDVRKLETILGYELSFVMLIWSVPAFVIQSLLCSHSTNFGRALLGSIMSGSIQFFEIIHPLFSHTPALFDAEMHQALLHRSSCEFLELHMPNLVAIGLQLLTQPCQLPNLKMFTFVASFLHCLAQGFHSFESSKVPISIESNHEIKRIQEKIEVSSNAHMVANLISGQTFSSWHPTPSDTTSWIRIYLKPGVSLRDIGVLVSVKDSVSCPQVMRVRFGSSASDLTGDETVRCLHNLSSRTDEWRVMQVLEVSAKLAQSRVVQISFPDTSEPKVYGVVARAWGEGCGCSEGCQPLFKDFARRCLEACLASDERSAVADAEERRGELLRLCIRWLQLFHEDKRFAPREVSTKSCVFESEHPYPHNADIRHKISFPGAERLEITFDDRSRTETGCDYLQFFDLSSRSTMIGQSNTGRNADGHWPGVNGVPPLIHRGSVLEARFRSDGSVNDWGYLFTVRASFPELSSGENESFPLISVLLRSSIESIVFDLCFSNSVLALPHLDFMQPDVISCISRCFSSQACSKHLQSGILASVEIITFAALKLRNEHFPSLDILPIVEAISVVSSIYFNVKSNFSTNDQPAIFSQETRAFKVGDAVRLIAAQKPAVVSAAAAVSNDSRMHIAATSKLGADDTLARKSKITGTIIQVKTTRCVVKGLTGSKPYTFKYDQLEHANLSPEIVATGHAVVSAVHECNSSLLIELQCSILTHIWQFVSARHIDGITFEQHAANDQKSLCDVAICFGATSPMHHIAMSVGPALLFLRLFSLLSSFFDQTYYEQWGDTSSLLLMNSMRISLRRMASLLPRVLNLFPDHVFPRAVAALLFFVIRGNSKDASSALVSCFQISASVINILQDHITPFWPEIIQILYSKDFGRQHDPITDLSLMCDCKEFNESPSEKFLRKFESEHPYVRGSSHRFDIEFPGRNVAFR